MSTHSNPAKKPQAMSGMTAAAYAAYALSDSAFIFPITPASHMAETVEGWSVDGKLNLMGQTTDVTEMQSEKGVAGAVHGSLAAGALTSTFTASQGLMLMIPNLYKVSGELLPGVFHVTARSLSAHALSIFGDHQDIMAVRATGVAMLASTSVQECMDLSWVAHLSAIEGSLPFAHFFDGFRTSDEVASILAVEPEEMREHVPWDKVAQFRARAMDPLHPQARGTCQDPDVYFQNREAPNRFYDALPNIVQEKMDVIAQVTGRSYHLFDYVGAPDAEHVAVALCSACDVLDAAVRALNAQGKKVGVVKVRLYRPFSAQHFVAALPKTVRTISVLDRTKEAGSQGEPLYQDVCTAVLEQGVTYSDQDGQHPVRVLGGRYGLSSKDFTPTMAAAVFANAALPSKEQQNHFTVGITDDVTHTNLPAHAPLDALENADDMKQCVFYGFGSDGTVGANRQAATILGDHAGKWVQEYATFDSKKSGGLTVSYLRIADSQIDAPYLIEQADYVACHKPIYVDRRYPMAETLKEGGVFVLNCPWSDDELEERLNPSLKRALATRKARLYAIDASQLAADCGLGARINMIMETVFFKLSGVMDFDQAVEQLKASIDVAYASKGADVVAKNHDAVDKAVAKLRRVEVPAAWAHVADEPRQDESLPEFIREVFEPMERLEGNTLPVSKLDPAGVVPLGTCAYEKRQVAFEIPEWEPSKCVQCFECAFVCPHAAIRPCLAAVGQDAGQPDAPHDEVADELAGAPDGFETVKPFNPKLAGHRLRIQVYPQDCVGCGSCAQNCPGHALHMKPLESQLETQKENLAFAQRNVTVKDGLLPKTTVPGTQLQQPLLEFSGACAGCGETPYIKLLTQLFGDRLVLANATGCSSVWGAYMPAIPYTVNRHGRGPAWGNSLFEDNGEYGYGIARAFAKRRERLTDHVQAALADKATDPAVASTLKAWLDNRNDADASLPLGQAVCDALHAHPDTLGAADMLEASDMFQKKSVWAVGGDGWAYDIGFGGLDEVMALGHDLNVLVLDNEGYANTGGEMSKATQLGSVSGFTLDGKPTPKKNLGRMMIDYGYVYVAHVSLGANMQQVIDAMREAESYDGPSIVIALCPCISWGLKAGMSTTIQAQKDAVKSGYWPLFRYDPRKAKAGKKPLSVDYQAPDGALEEFLGGQNRYARLADRKPALSKRLQGELAKDREHAYDLLDKLKDVLD